MMITIILLLFSVETTQPENNPNHEVQQSLTQIISDIKNLKVSDKADEIEQLLEKGADPLMKVDGLLPLEHVKNAIYFQKDKKDKATDLVKIFFLLYEQSKEMIQKTYNNELGQKIDNIRRSVVNKAEKEGIALDWIRSIDEQEAIKEQEKKNHEFARGCRHCS